MLENLPDVPNVEQIEKNPRASETKFLYGLVIFLIGLFAWSRFDRAKPDPYLVEQNQQLLKDKLESSNKAIDIMVKYGMVVEENRNLKDTLNKARQIAKDGLLPPSKKIISNGK